MASVTCSSHELCTLGLPEQLAAQNPNTGQP